MEVLTNDPSMLNPETSLGQEEAPADDGDIDVIEDEEMIE